MQLNYSLSNTFFNGNYSSMDEKDLFNFNSTNYSSIFSGSDNCNYSNYFASNNQQNYFTTPQTYSNNPQMNVYEAFDFLGKIGGADKSMSYKELNAATNNPYGSGLNKKEKFFGSQIFNVLKTMLGSGLFNNKELGIQEISNIAGADGDYNSLTADDTNAMNATWNTPGYNNDGQLGLNELFANDGKGKFTSAGFLGYFADSSGQLTKEGIQDRLSNGIYSPDEREMAMNLIKYMDAKEQTGLSAIVSPQEIKQMLKADPNGNKLSLTASDIQAATNNLSYRFV